MENKMEDKVKIEETIHTIAYKVGSEGLAYWIQNYSSRPSGDDELDSLVQDAKEAIYAFEARLEELMEEHGAEYG